MENFLDFSSTDSNGNGILPEDQSNEFHRLPSITSMTMHQIDSNTDDANGSFEDEDEDEDVEPIQTTNPSNSLTAHVLYDFNSKESKYSIHGRAFCLIQVKESMVLNMLMQHRYLLVNV